MTVRDIDFIISNHFRGEQQKKNHRKTSDIRHSMFDMAIAPMRVYDDAIDRTLWIKTKKLIETYFVSSCMKGYKNLWFSIQFPKNIENFKTQKRQTVQLYIENDVKFMRIWFGFNGIKKKKKTQILFHCYSCSCSFFVPCCYIGFRALFFFRLRFIWHFGKILFCFLIHFLSFFSFFFFLLPWKLKSKSLWQSQSQ